MILILLIIRLLHAPAFASSDVGISARISTAAAQDQLASPPLPSLESSSGRSLSPQVGYTKATINGADGSLTYGGDLKGYSGALSFMAANQGPVSFFGFLGGSSLKGTMVGTVSNSTTTVTDESKVFTGAFGLSARLLGASNSPLAFGAFIGPAFMRIKSSFDGTAVFTDNSPSTSLHYALSPNAYGIYTGLQMKLRLNNFLINPYVLYFKDISDECRKFDEGSYYDPTGSCPMDSIKLKTSFVGMGLFLGYGNLRLNVYSKAFRDEEYNDISTTTYSLSVSFNI